jgi:sphingolipid 4-desaturase/C4-monooxygenase
MKKADFIYSDSSEPHRIRTRQILKQHPDVRKLIGKNPRTILFILFLVSFQISGAFFMADKPWWAIFVAAYFVGAFVDHALFVMIHECAHKLIFKNPVANRLAGIFANIPQVFPSSVSFERYHIKHHSFQGVHELDADLPNRWEAKLINNYFIGKVIWFLFYPLFQAFRVARLKEIKPFDGWIALNWGVQIAFVAAVWYFLGPKAVAFLTASFFFSVGLHPLGGRWIQEHYLTHGEQETYSYYGPLNAVAFNVGYHNEHHDFPSVPWNKLPELKKAALPYYDSLTSHNSWTKLWLRFIFDRELSLWSRVVRKNRGKVALVDESKPDVEMITKVETNTAVA